MAVSPDSMVVRRDGLALEGVLLWLRDAELALEGRDGVVLRLRADQIDWSRSRIQPRPPVESPMRRMWTSSPRVVSGALARPRRWSGSRISLDFKDADLKDVLRLMAQISGLNVVVAPEVEGKLTMTLRDVPWDQALDIICKNFGLEYEVDGTLASISR
jgi:hypothetical protein